jgi:aminoglycoside 2'-N-acetyltransferase I
MRLTIRVVSHRELSRDDLAGLQALFNAEYLTEFGDWNPEQPYGYAPHDVHVIARRGDLMIGHVGWARRDIGVGDQDVVIAGVGGVLVADDARGLRLGEQLMRKAVESMSEAEDIEFGYLGCREAVAPFYQSCGWTRVTAAERSLDRAGRPSADPPGQPLLVLALGSSSEWPEGDIDLRGRAW